MHGCQDLDAPNPSIVHPLLMHLLLVGISHQTAPVELRERLDFQVRGVDRALRALAARGSTREAVVLSTCNRAEMYVACDDVAATRADLVSFVSEFHGVDRADPARRTSTTSPISTPRAICFASRPGLDSLVVGEPQILGQVKEAHTVAGEVADRRTGAQPALPLVVRRRQARAHGNRPRVGRGVGQLRRRRAGAEDLRRPRRAATCSSSAPARWASSPPGT